MASVVQSKLREDLSGSATSVLTFDNPIASGNFILVVGGFDSAVNLTSLVDGSSDAVTDSGIGIFNTTDGVKLFCKAFFTATAGVTTVTANLSTNPAFCAMKAFEVSGLASPVFDKFNSNPNAASPFTSNATGTLSSATEIAVGINNATATTTAISSPFDTNGEMTPAGFGWGYSYLITGSTASLTYSGTLSSGSGGALIATVQGSPVTYQVNGVTRDNIGNLIGSCDVFLLKYNSGTHLFTQIAHTTSNASTGAYAFTGLNDNDPSYSVVAWKDGTPHVYDVSDRNIKPV